MPRSLLNYAACVSKSKRSNSVYRLVGFIRSSPAPVFIRSAFLLLFALLTHSAESLAADNPAAAYAGWPDGWVKAYEDFERFIAGQNATWPSSKLEISTDGTITHGVRLAESRSEGVYFYLFHHGREVLAVGMADELGDRYGYVCGKYAAAVRVSGHSGYQYLYPLVWFEIVMPPPGDPPSEAGSFPFRVRVQPSPADPESVWPNERLLRFQDFAIFPGEHPWSIEKRNPKVSPAITLTLDNHGRAERELVKEVNAEHLLHWRVYHNGRLIRRDSAAEITQAELDRGPGTYQACIGVEGPSGFMPVSNVLAFPLFPDASGKNTVTPSDGGGDGTPDFIQSLPPDDRQLGIRQGREPDDIISAGETPRNLRELWESWKTRLKIQSPVTR
jgi:hypothetical protein